MNGIMRGPKYFWQMAMYRDDGQLGGGNEGTSTKAGPRQLRDVISLGPSQVVETSAEGPSKGLGKWRPPN